MPPLYLDTSALDFSAITDTYTKIADPTAAVRPEFATERQAPNYQLRTGGWPAVCRDREHCRGGRCYYHWARR